MLLLLESTRVLNCCSHTRISPSPRAALQHARIAHRLRQWLIHVGVADGNALENRLDGSHCESIACDARRKQFSATRTDYLSFSQKGGALADRFSLHLLIGRLGGQHRVVGPARREAETERHLEQVHEA